MTKLLNIFIVTLMSLSLTACGGSGGGGNGGTTTPPVANVLPTVNAGADITVQTGAQVSLTGTAADSDGTIASYQWSASDNSIALTGATSANVSFTAPDAAASITMTLTVTDNSGGTATDTVVVTVEAANELPTANAGADQTVNARDTVTLTGTATDTDGTIASYQWVSSDADIVLTDADTANASFTAPDTAANVDVTFTLTATDDRGGTASDTAVITVRPFGAQAFTHTMTLAGETITINFEKFSNRGPNFAVFEQQADGTLAPHEPGPVRTYIGSVTDRPGAIASGLRRADGTILARVTFENGVEWIDQGTTVITFEFDPFTPKYPGSVVRNGGAGSTLYGADLGVDLPFVQVARSGGTTATALEIAEYSTMGINLVYLRDVAIFHRLERVIVRLDEAADPYNGQTADTGLMLNKLAEQWDTVLPAGNHDLALVASPNVGGGLAFGSAIGDPGYSANGSSTVTGDFGPTSRHEIGHNWSLNHFDGGTPEGPTINSGNDLGKMSGPEMELVLNHRTARLSFLDDLGAFAQAVPPRAADERITVEPIGGSIPIDVLANDNDTNGDTLSILSFDAQTNNGLTVTQDGTMLRVQAPSVFSPTDDYFSYRIQDASGLTSSAVVHLRSVLPGSGLGHFTFENSTTAVYDSSSRASHGTLAGDASINGNGELVLDGQGDYASVSPPNVTTDAVTFSAFVFRDGNQEPGAGIVVVSPTDDPSGLLVGDGNLLAYTWGPVSDQFDTGFVIPEQTWTFIAAVIEPTKATIYMDSGTGMQSVVNEEANIAKTLTGFFQLGADPDADPAGPLFWRGRMDDVRVENRPLSSVEIAALATRDLGARNPSPFHTEQIADAATTLTWTPSQNMMQQRVYYSTSYTEVRDGVVGGSADQGVPTGNSFQLNGLSNGVHYWRIDSTEPSGEVKGNIWTFVR